MLVPKPLQNVNYQRTLRQNGTLKRYSEYRKMYDMSKEAIKNSLPKKKTIEAPKRISPHFTNEVLLEYADKRIHLVDTREKRFKQMIEQYLASLEQKVLSNIKSQSSLKKYVQKDDLFDQEFEVGSAVDLFTPLLDDIMIVAGQQAYNLLKRGSTYSPTAKIHDLVSSEVEKFATSMLETDKARLTDAITSAFAQGSSIPEVRNQVTSIFGDIKKYQSERIARTELLRASNYGQLDAYKESGVVSGTQWVVDGNPCSECQDLDGEIISLDSNWDNLTTLDTSYGTVEAPPLHPNCECTVVPVLEDITDNSKALEQENAELKDYISELEKVAGIDEKGA